MCLLLSYQPKRRDNRVCWKPAWLVRRVFDGSAAGIKRSKIWRLVDDQLLLSRTHATFRSKNKQDVLCHSLKQFKMLSWRENTFSFSVARIFAQALKRQVCFVHLAQVCKKNDSMPLFQLFSPFINCPTPSPPPPKKNHSPIYNSTLSPT